MEKVEMGSLKEMTESMDTHDLNATFEARVEMSGNVCIHTPGSAFNTSQQDVVNLTLSASCVPLSEYEELKRAFEELRQNHIKLKSLFDQERGVALELGSHCSHDSVHGGNESGSDMMSDISSSTSGDSGLQDTFPDVPFQAGQKRTGSFPYFRSPVQKKTRTEHETPWAMQQLTTRLTSRNKQRQQKHLSEKYSSTMNTSLHIAATEGFLGTVENILSCGFININCKGEGGKTALMLAAENGKINVFDFLVNRDCDRGVTDDDGNTILHAACAGGDLAIIKRVLQWGMVDRNWKNKAGLTPMMAATGSGELEVCKLLTTWGCQ